MADTPKSVTGKLLNDLWVVGAAHALYREDGRWYHHLERFPGALFDSNGYVPFYTEAEYLSSPYLQRAQDLHVDRGISAIPGYVRISASGSLAEFSAHVNTIKRASPTKKELAEDLADLADLADLGPMAETMKAADIEDNDEAERVRPLGAGYRGPDVIENVLCVGPNHHAELDYGAIGLHESKIRTVPGHCLGPEFTEYHNRFIFGHGRPSTLRPDSLPLASTRIPAVPG